MSTTPDAQPGLRWRILRSLWLVGPLVGFGCLGGASFIYIGLRARRPAWWIPGVGYLVVSIVAISLTDDADTTTTLGTWAVWVLIATWLISIVHAGLANPAWLQWQATRAGLFSLPRTVELPGPAWQASPSPLPDIVPDAAQFYAPPGGTASAGGSAPPGGTASAGGSAPPGGTASAGGSALPGGPAPFGGSAWPTAPTPLTAPAPPLDVNTASAEQLAMLPGLDLARAQRIVALRQARRGFASVDEFATAAELAPHEFVHTRRLIICTPRPHEGSVGRVLDV